MTLTLLSSSSSSEISVALALSPSSGHHKQHQASKQAREYKGKGGTAPTRSLLSQHPQLSALSVSS